jgi:hypothetical protein
MQPAAHLLDAGAKTRQRLGLEIDVAELDDADPNGAGKPTTKIIEEQADRYAFLFKNLEMSVPASWTAAAMP